MEIIYVNRKRWRKALFYQFCGDERKAKHGDVTVTTTKQSEGKAKT